MTSIPVEFCKPYCPIFLALREKIVQENERIRSAIGDTPVIGFFTNGEQRFLGDSSSCHVNYTVTALGISNNVMSKK